MILNRLSNYVISKVALNIMYRTMLIMLLLSYSNLIILCSNCRAHDSFLHQIMRTMHLFVLTTTTSHTRQKKNTKRTEIESSAQGDLRK